MMDGHLNESSSTMVLSFGQKMDPGGLHPNLSVNRIIWLQPVAEIITNETAKALNILAKEQTKMLNAIYQNHLALDDLLVSEGGVCGKFNLSNSAYRQMMRERS
jgi:hypothetical protein